MTRRFLQAAPPVPTGQHLFPLLFSRALHPGGLSQGCDLHSKLGHKGKGAESALPCWVCRKAQGELSRWYQWVPSLGLSTREPMTQPFPFTVLASDGVGSVLSGWHRELSLFPAYT